MLKESLMQPTKLQVRSSEIGGYGVFAVEDIEEGEVVEEATFVLTKYRTTDVYAKEIEQICYPYPCGCERCRIVGPQLCLSSGHIDLYNHGDDLDQNVKFEWNSEDRIVTVRATRCIVSGEEVLHSYGPNYVAWDDVK